MPTNAEMMSVRLMSPHAPKLQDVIPSFSNIDASIIVMNTNIVILFVLLIK
jgi:hypothetical protein